MKRKHLLNTLLFTAVAGIGYLTFSSYSGGPAFNSRNCTGAKSSTTTCGGGGCHGGTSTNTTVAIAVDSTGNVPVINYVPGMTYTIKITGTNSSNLSKFGFQYVAVSGTGSSQLQAGTYSNLPSGVFSDPLNSLNFVEHGQTLTTATAGSYNLTFNWTAPAAGTGTVTMYCTLNAVDGNGQANSADKSNNTSISLNEIVTSSGCDTMQNLAANATSSTSVNATWVAPAGSMGCQWAINTTGVTPTTPQGSTTTASHSFTGLTANTNYTVFVRDSCGAGNFSAWTKTTVHTPLGINNIGFGDVAISAYPNPVMNSLNIKLDNAANGTYYVKMININGQIVLNQAIAVNSSNFETSINTAALANGMYALQITKDGAQHTIAIVKH